MRAPGLIPFALAAILAAPVAPAAPAVPTPPAQPPAPPAPTENHAVADLEKLIRAQDWTAVDVAKAEGARCIPRLEPFLADAEPNIRVLAVDCLGAIRGTRAQELLVRALTDRFEQVRANAVSALHDDPPLGREKDLGEAFDRNTKDPFARQQIAMVLGRLKGPAALGELIGRTKVDLSREVQDGIASARAKLDDAEGREQFAELVRDASGLRAGHFIDFVRYQNDPWVLPLLSLWIDRREIAQRLSTHVSAVERRTCDLAVDETLRLNEGRKTFSFPPKPAAQYTDAEIGEVRAYLQSLGRSPYLKR